MEQTNSIFEQLFFGYELKIWMILFSTFISIIALIFSTLDIKTRLLNVFKVRKLKYSAEHEINKLLLAVLYSKGEVKYDELEEQLGDIMNLELYDKDFLKKLENIYSQCDEIYINSFFKGKKLWQLKEALKIILNITKDNDIVLLKLMFPGSYGYVTPHYCKLVESVYSRSLRKMFKTKNTKNSLIMYFIKEKD